MGRTLPPAVDSRFAIGIALDRSRQEMSASVKYLSNGDWHAEVYPSPVKFSYRNPALAPRERMDSPKSDIMAGHKGVFS
jgi:hypothetical protein